jgi:hypothetical protein
MEKRPAFDSQEGMDARRLLAEARCVIESVEVAKSVCIADDKTVVGRMEANRILQALDDAGFKIVRVVQTERRPFVIDEAE